MTVQKILEQTVVEVQRESEGEGYTAWAERVGSEMIMGGDDFLSMFIIESVKEAADPGKAAYVGFAIFRMFQIQHPELLSVSEGAVERVRKQHTTAPHEEAIITTDRLLRDDDPEVGKFIVIFSNQFQDERLTFVAAMAYEMCQLELESRD